MSNITLHYFDVYGRAELLRMLLHYHGTQFTDHRVQFQEWPQIKTSGLCEFEQLPILDVNGQRLSQTQSISRYLCNLWGYGVTDPESVYWVESVSDLTEDIGNGIGKLAFAKDMEGLNAFYRDKVPGFLKMLEARLVRNNGGNGFFVANHPTKADFHVFGLLHDKINKHHPELIDQHAPKLRQFLNRFKESSRTLSSYLDNRPPRDF